MTSTGRTRCGLTWTARNLGASLGFFSANDCYWQIRFEQSPATGDANLVIVAYKETWQQDPATQDPSTYYLVTTRWRDPHVTLPGNPEDGLIGEMYNEFEPVNGDILITQTASPPWLFANTGLVPGSTLPGLLGYEVDRIYQDASTPANIQLIAET